MTSECRKLTARERLRKDLARYYFLHGATSSVQRLRTILSTEAVWAIIIYRFRQYLRQEAPALVRILLKIPCWLVRNLIEYVVGIHLDPVSKIDGGLYIGHYGGIWISPKATVGANCNISQGVTLGAIGTRAGPVLGERVWVGPNAVITGPARVGSGAVIAANSLVASDIPENAVAIGVPARIMSYGGSATLIGLPDSPEAPHCLKPRGRLSRRART
jgi:serine O-acetyltransferase